MKPPSCVLQIRPDKTAIICAWCPDKIAGDSWAVLRGYEISHSACPRCAKIKEEEIARLTSTRVNREHETRTEAQVLKILNND